MKKNMKKAFASLLAATMVMSMSVTAWATEDAPQETTFTKTYKLLNDGTKNPEETFTFKFTPWKVTNSNSNVKLENMPSIADSTIKFNSNTATVAGSEEKVKVALSNVEWPGVGIYYYDVAEVAGNTAGVTYDINRDQKAKLKVTVAYNQGTDTYYTAFVTLENYLEKGTNGTTTVKTAGFENMYSAGSLAVKKTATGNLADQTKEFDVTVTFIAPKNDDNTYKSVNESISYVEDGATKTIKSSDWKDNKAEVVIKLHHNETITFTNIPYGVTYTVVESDYTAEKDGAYDAAKYALNIAEGKTAEDVATVSENGVTDEMDTASETVDIVNNKGTVVDTGILLDSAPYVLLLAIAGVGAFAVATKKREEEF